MRVGAATLSSLLLFAGVVAIASSVFEKKHTWSTGAVSLNVIPSIDAFDCTHGVATAEYDWSQDKKFYCCSHLNVGCPKANSAAATLVIANIRFNALKANPTLLKHFESSIQTAISGVVGYNVKAANVKLSWWEGSGLHSTHGGQDNKGIVVNAKVVAPPPTTFDQVHAKLNAKANLKTAVEVAVRQIPGISAVVPPQAGTAGIVAKDIVVARKIVDDCTCTGGVAATRPACPAIGGEMCSSCNTGFTLSTGLECMENKCTCADGIGAKGSACPSQGALHCASCVRGFHAVADNLTNTQTCTQNVCKCANGTVATGKYCTMDQAVICTKCFPGYHEDDMVCEANNCTCVNGVEAQGADCTRDKANICHSCSKGFHVDANKHCVRNRCKCPNGEPALGELCAVDQKIICAACDGALLLHKDGTCGNKTCHCPNGVVDTGNACNTHGSMSCHSCNVGYWLTNKQCVSLGCSCHHGVPASGKACPQKGVEKCDTCHHGYTLSPVDFTCKPNTCTCGNGTAAIGASCRVTGSLSCTSCNAGYHISLRTVTDGGTSKLAVDCKENKCHCQHGEEATVSTNPVCHTNGFNLCSVCDPGYHMGTHVDAAGHKHGHQCLTNVCKCHYGTSVVAPLCMAHNAENCSHCDANYFLADAPIGNNWVHGQKMVPPKATAFDDGKSVCLVKSLTTSLAFDCHSALANWETAWSKVKKHWCCKHKSIGCVPTKTESAMCSGHWDQSQCLLIGCCHWDAGRQKCSPATGVGNSLCHPEFYIKSAVGGCITAKDYQGTQPTLQIDACAKTDAGQDWAPVSDGAGKVMIKDGFYGVCLHVLSPAPGGTVTVKECATPNDHADEQAQLISFVPTGAADPSRGLLRHKSGNCLAVVSKAMKVVVCNKGDLTQQFIAAAVK